jgi:replicative DNA helicase
MAPIIIDNLQKFGLEFQSKIIAGILSEQTFLERVLDIADPEAFENEAHRWILKETFSYYYEYKTVPTLQVFRVRIDTIANTMLKQMVVDTLKVVYMKLTDSDLDFVREQFLEFCKNQKLKSAILESVDHLKSGEYEKVKHLVDEAMKAGMERNLGHNYHIEIEKRMSAMSRKTVPTGWEVVDSLVDGGLGPGELGVIVAPAGIGKSWLLARIGAEAMKRGKHVLHYTMELNENYVGLRYDCCFTGIQFQDIKNNIEAVKEKIKTIPGKLFVKYFPIKTVSAQSLKFHFERVMMLENIKASDCVIVVDYADILRPIEKEKNSNSYSEMGGIYEELRMIAGELCVPLWTASQTNRGGAGEDVVQAHNVADSYRKIMTADFVMSVSRKMNDKQNNTARMHIIKNRFGPDGITLYSKMDAGNGDIQIYDEKSRESMAIKSLMESDAEDSENDVKKQLSSKWRSSRQDTVGSNSNL